MSNQVGSSTVDQRIVEMRIDNEKFEAGAKKTISILESLDRSLKGLGEENATGLDTIEKSLDKVTDRFSAMGIVGDQIMRNLTNKAMELVGQLKNMSTMLTTQQVGAGWDKYADKTQAIQTIMAATNKEIENGRFADQAEQLEWVNEQIEKLNKFTDETSYNFLDMVGNIGKFTAAGRGLEESVTAMEGIANWAAISGGRPAEASRAMYNLSQALGMGKVTQLDWKSIENANMATYEFKQQVIEVAEELGTVRKIADGIWEDADGHKVTVETFRDNLKDGWFDSNVLLKVLNRYGEFSDVLLKVSDATGKTATEILSQIKAYKEDGEVVSWLSPYIKELTKDEYELGLRAFQAAQEAKTFTEAIEATKDAVSTKWMTVFELLFGNYLEAKELWTNMSEVFWDIFANPVDHLIDIIKGAGGFLTKEGIFSGFISGAEQAAGGTAVLEDRLGALGKNMDDFRKALNKTMGPKQVKQIVDDYGSLEEALRNGAITIDQFKLALGELDDSFDPKKPTTLNRALNKAGKTAADFEKALREAMEPRDVVRALEKYQSLEDAFRNGAISVEDFKEALNSLGIDSENVTEDIQETVRTGVGNIAEMRELALEVLRGDHGNGDERLAWYESMGLDPELMQAMVGDLKNIARAGLDDDYLLEIMESYYQANNLQARLGYATFAEYLASCMGATEEYVYDMNNMANEADDIYASLFGEGVIDQVTGKYYSAGELFRMSITNLLDALDKFGESFDEAFLRVFGGSDDYDESIGKMSNGFFTLTAAFYSFSERVLAFSKSETFSNFMTAVFTITRLIGKALGIVFKIGKVGLSVVMKLLSPILKLATSMFKLVTTGLDAISRTIDDLSILNKIDELGSRLRDKIVNPIEKINKAINTLIDTFLDGFKNGGGIVGGMQNVTKAMDQMLENHPVLQTVIHALGSAFLFLADVVKTLAMVFGGLFGGAIALVITAFGKLGEWFGQFVIWARSSELLNGIWQALTTTFQKIGRVLKRVFGYAEQGFQEGGFFGAFIAVSESFERGVKRLVPGGEKIIEIFNSIGKAIHTIFGRRKTGDNPEILSDAESGVQYLEESVSSISNGLEKLTDETEGLLPKITRAGEAIGTVVNGIIGDEQQKEEFEDNVAGFVQRIWQGILKGLRQIKLRDVIGALRLSLIASIATSILSAITVFKDIGKAVKSIPDTIQDVGERFAGMMRALSATFTANAVLKFAAAAVLVALALRTLVKIPQDDLTHAGVVLIAIIGVMALLAKYISNTRLNTFKVLGQLPSMTGMLFGMSNLIISLAAAAVVLTIVQHFGIGKFRRAAAVIIAIILAVGAIIAAVVLFSQLYNAEKIRAMSKMMLAVGAAMVLIGIGVRKLVTSIVMLSLIQNFGVGKFRRAVLAVGILLAALAVGIGSMTRAADHLDEKELLAMGHMILRISASLSIVAFAVQMLTLPIIALSLIQSFGGKIGGATAAVVILLAAVGFIVNKLAKTLTRAGYSNMEQIGKTMLKIAASLLVAAAAMTLMMIPINTMAKLCSKLDNWDIVTGILFLLGTVAAIGMLLTTWNKTAGINGGGGMLKVAGAITLIAFAMLLLTPAVVVLTAAVSAFAGILGGLDDKKWDKFGKGLWRMVGLSAAVTVFGLALITLGLGAVAAGAGIVSIAGGIFLLIAAVAVLMLALPKFIEMLQNLKDTSLTDLWNSLRKVGLAMLVFGVMTGWILTGLFRLFGVLKPETLGRIGTGFASFFRGLVTSASNGTKSGFQKVVDFLQDPKNRQVILAALKTIVVLAAGYISGLIPTFTHVIVSGIVDLVTSIADEVEAQGGQLVDALTRLVKAILGLVKDMIARLFGEESWDELDGWQQKLVEGGGILLIVKKLAGAVSFAKGEETAESFADRILGIPEKINEIKDSWDNTKAAVDLVNESTGGLLASMGPLVIAALAVAAALVYAGNSLNEQQKILEDRAFEGLERDLEGYDNAIADTQKRIADLQTAMDNGATEWSIVQEKDALELMLKTLQQEREELAQQVEAEQQAAASADNFASGIKDARDAMAMLQTVDLSEFGYTMEQISRMADGELIEVARQIEQNLGQPWERAGASATEAAEEVNAATETISSGYDAFLTKFSELGFSKDSTMSEIVSSLGLDQVQSLVNQYLPDASLDLSTLSIGGMDEFASMLGEAGIDVGGDLTGGIGKGMLGSDGLGALLSSATQVKDLTLEDFCDIFQVNSPSKLMAREVGQYIPAGIGEGIDKFWYTAVNPLYKLMDEMTNTFLTIREHFVDSGTQIVSGLVQGLNLNMQYAYNTGAALAASVENGFRDRLLIRSPSQVFANLARYIPMGVSEGIEAGEGGAIDSIVVFGNELVNAIMRSMVTVSTIANDEFDFQPRITPVVDLSNVSSATGVMGGMFGNGHSVSAQMSSAISRRMDNVERIASAMNNQQTINNGDNITFNIYQQPGEDPNAIADAVMVRMNNRLIRRGVAFG